jgi:hypothetical protein
MVASVAPGTGMNIRLQNQHNVKLQSFVYQHNFADDLGYVLPFPKQIPTALLRQDGRPARQFNFSSGIAGSQVNG